MISRNVLVYYVWTNAAQKLRHGQDPAESPNKVDVREIVDVGAASKLPLLQAHGRITVHLENVFECIWYLLFKHTSLFV